MSELQWNWVYYPYLDAPNKQEESALKAGYIKVVSKDEADKVIVDLKAENEKLNAQFYPLYEELKRVKDENESLKKTLQHSEDELESYFIFEKEIKQELRATHKALCLLRAENAENRIAFFDKDETYSPDYVEERVGFWEKVKNYWQAKAKEYK